ncbi:hypothetical protein D3C72_2198900 [compost metagenome]
MRLAMGWDSMAARLWARMSMSTPSTLRREARGSIVVPASMASLMSRSASSEALSTSEPPWAMPVSMMRSGRTRHTSSCMATMSCGYWMIGRPIQSKL